MAHGDAGIVTLCINPEDGLEVFDPSENAWVSVSTKTVEVIITQLRVIDELIREYLLFNEIDTNDFDKKYIIIISYCYCRTLMPYCYVEKPSINSLMGSG